MASPRSYDADPPPPGSPRLFGSIGVLSGRRLVCEMRPSAAAEMTEAERRRYREKMIVAVAHACGIPQSWIADVFGVTQQAVSLVCVEVQEQVEGPKTCE